MTSDISTASKGIRNERVVQAALIIHRNIEQTEDVWIAEMVREGFEAGEANRFAAFMPMAFARPVMEQLGAKEFVETVSVEAGDGAFFDILLENQPEYVASLHVGRLRRFLDPAPAKIIADIASTSAEIDAANHVFNEGSTLKDATVASTIGALYAPYVIR
jgi:hypothetical protein